MVQVVAAALNSQGLGFGRARCQQAGHPGVYTGEADEMSYRGNGKLGDAEAPDAVEDSAKRGDPVRSPALRV